ncbi:MAG: AraC family transcriptional regulator [Pseudomonadota bacterium]
MPNAYEARLRRVIDYIYDHADEDLSLDTLADVAAMSRFHWHRIFRAMTGETCAQAVRRVRLQRAGFMLSNTDKGIDEIAKSCGLGGRAAFTRAFTDAYGIPPARFRGWSGERALLVMRPSEDFTMFDVTIEDTGPLRAATHPHKGDYTQIARAFEQFSAIMTSRNLWPHTRGMIGAYFDDPSAVPVDELRSLAGAVVDEKMEIPDGLSELRIPAGPLAKLRFKGPYAGLPQAYDYLYGQWITEAGREPNWDVVSFELYVNSPMDTAPEDLLTDICVPLKAA